MRNDPDALMLFSAGFGTRMGDLTRSRPKPLIPVSGRTLIDHAIDQAKGVPLRQTVVNAHYLSSQIHDHFKGSDNVTVIDEHPDILETGGGLRNALPVLGPAPCFTLNTDAVWAGPPALRMLLDAWNPTEMDALLLVIPSSNVVGHRGDGDFLCAANGTLTRGPGTVYSGAQILKTEALLDIDQTVFSLNVLWNKYLAAGRLYGVEYPGMWCDVGQPESITLAENMLEKNNV
jgi:MurNAc alpha-1-phosphate uridylyltransferase